MALDGVWIMPKSEPLICAAMSVTLYVVPGNDDGVADNLAQRGGNHVAPTRGQVPDFLAAARQQPPPPERSHPARDIADADDQGRGACVLSSTAETTGEKAYARTARPRMAR